MCRSFSLQPESDYKPVLVFTFALCAFTNQHLLLPVLILTCLQYFICFPSEISFNACVMFFSTFSCGVLVVRNCLLFTFIRKVRSLKLHRTYIRNSFNSFQFYRLFSVTFDRLLTTRGQATFESEVKIGRLRTIYFFPIIATETVLIAPWLLKFVL